MRALCKVLEQADQCHVALGHFNVSDLVGFKAVVSAARQLNVPVLVGVSEGEREFVRVEQISALVRTARDEYGHPVFLNADHTHSLERAMSAAKARFDEVIFDLSDKPFEENLKQTKQAVELLKSIRPEILVGRGNRLHWSIFGNRGSRTRVARPYHTARSRSIRFRNES